MGYCRTLYVLFSDPTLHGLLMPHHTCRYSTWTAPSLERTSWTLEASTPPQAHHLMVRYNTGLHVVANRMLL